MKESTQLNKPCVMTCREEIFAAVCKAKDQGKKVGVVPTMGALHKGHLSLVRAAVSECDFTVVTIFINPTQFGPQEGFEGYPRTLEEDLASLAKLQVDLVFAPTKEQMYPPGHSTFVEPPDVAAPWEGQCRNNHFRGVTTVVLKLLNLIPADIAYFGQKDYQQSVVIRRMVTDLDLPVKIKICPIVREPSGLAMSSRNRNLTPSQLQQARALSQSLELAAKLIDQGEQNAQRVVEQMQEVLTTAGIQQIDYIALADPETLQQIDAIDRPLVAMIAAHFGQTRLIDNRLIG